TLGKRFAGSAKAHAAVGMKAEPAHRQEPVDLMAKLTCVRGASDDLLEMPNRAGEVPRRAPRPAPLSQQAGARPIRIGRRSQAIENAERAGQIVDCLLVTEAFRGIFCGLAKVAQRTRQITALLEMQRKRSRNVFRPARISLLEAFAPAVMDLEAPCRAEPSIEHVLIENVMESVGSGIGP